MTRDQLIEQIASKAGITKGQGEDALKAFTEAVTSALSRGEDVALTGFGAFKVSNRAARQGVNPRTGEKVQVPAMKVAKFKAGKGLKDAVR